MAPYRSPGVYLAAAAERRFMPVEPVPLSVAAFLGIAQRGPVHTPRRIHSFNEFRESYGAPLPHASLAHAVAGFFANGGRACYVIRIAHSSGDEGGAACSTLLTRSRSGADFLAITASSEGTWGDRIKVDIDDPRWPTTTLLVEDLRRGASRARVKSTRGFAPGDVVELADGRASQYVVLTEVDSDELSWSPEVPARSSFVATAPTRLTALEFRLTLAFDTVVEEFDHLTGDPRSERYFVRVVNGRSRLATVTDRRVSRDVFDPPVTVRNAVLAGGRDGLAMLTAEDFIGISDEPGARRGLGALEEIDDVGLIAVPDVMTAPQVSARFGERDIQVVQDAVVRHCDAKQRKDRFAILDAPPGCDVDQVRDWRRRFDSKYAALYHPWVKVMASGAAGGTRTVPSSGHVAGIYARCEHARGIHRAPANEVLEDVIGLETTLSLDTQGLLTHEHVNCLRVFPGRGIRVWGARTLSSDAAWRYVNVRRLVTMIELSIEQGTQWAVFEDNDPTLWKQVVRSISDFLRDLTRKGYLVGETDEEAFYVKCDEETNPPEVVDAGQLICEIGVAPVRPAEFIVFRIGQRTDEPIVE